MNHVIFWHKTHTSSRDLLFVLAGVCLLTLSAYITIPMQPIPLTFQSAAVIFIGMVSGARLGAYTLAAYLIAGFCGLPVFTPKEVPAIMSPTFGYLLGYLPAAALSGYLAERGMAKTIIKRFISACAGAIVIFACGVMGLAQFIGWDKAIALGLMPFIFTEPMKLLVTSLIVPVFWKK